ncbi:MAG: hypothetical protein ACI892_002432, partial [Marinobacter maritimus]
VTPVFKIRSLGQISALNLLFWMGIYQPVAAWEQQPILPF